MTIKGLSLADFKPRIVEVEILDAGGAVMLTVPLASLSWSDYHAARLSVAEPEAPVKRDFDERLNKIVTVADTTDEAYRTARVEAEVERRKRQLVLSLLKAGNLPELADEPIERQVAALDEFDAGIVEALYRALNQLVVNARERVAQQADNFRQSDNTNAQGGAAARAYAQPVA